VKQITKGVNALHSISIVHNDLNSKNILLSKNFEQVKICDFGNAYVIGCNTENVALERLVTAAPYRAPELWTRSPEPTKKTDAYSFGILMWEVSTEYDPFKAAILNETIIRETALNGASISDLLFADGKCNEEWKKLIKQCVQIDPDTRPCFSDLLASL